MKFNLANKLIKGGASALVAIFLLASGASSANALVNAAMTPSSGTYSRGGTLSVTIALTSTAGSVTAIGIDDYMTYDPAVFSAPTITRVETGDWIPGMPIMNAAFEANGVNPDKTQYSAGAGTWGGIVHPGLNIGSAPVNLFRLDFPIKATAPLGNTNIEFDTITNKYKVIATGNTVVTGSVANGTFNITAPVPTITVTAPNAAGIFLRGGQTNYPITWTSADFTGNVKIQYSIDNKATWTDIVASTGNTGSYRWPTVPGANSIRCYIRIVNAAGGTPTDDSDNPFTIDSTAPTVSNVTSSKADGTYGTGIVIPIAVTLSENVTVNTTGGSPSLLLETGTNDHYATYVNKLGSTLNFTYTVVNGDTSPDLDYASPNALELNGATIKDLAGNDAIGTLYAPGTGAVGAGSLGKNKAIVIATDSVDPTFPGVITFSPTTPINDEFMLVTFTWEAASDASGIANYYYSFDKDAKLNPTVEPATSLTSDATTIQLGLPRNIIWPSGAAILYFHIVAVDNAGNKTYKLSDRVIFDTTGPIGQTTTPIPTPAPYTTTGQVTFTWENNGINDPESGIVGYKIWIKKTPGSFIPPVTTAETSYIISLNNGQSVSIEVAPVNGAGVVGDFSPWSSVVTCETNKPSAPTTVYDGSVVNSDITSQTSTSTISANWPAAAMTGVVSGLDRYEYAIGTTAGGTETKTWTSAGTNLTFTDATLTLVPGSTYYVSVRAVSKAGNVGAVQTSNGVLVQTDTTAPALVTNFTASDNQTSVINLNWTNPADADLQSVVVLRKVGSYPTSHTDGTVIPNNNSTPGAAITLIDNDATLVVGTIYYYAVFSRDVTGNWNNTVTAGSNADTGRLVSASAGVPLNFLITKSGNNAVLTWAQPTEGAPGTGYHVYRSTTPNNIVSPANLITSTASNVLTYTDNSVVSNATSYYYVITSYAPGVESGPSIIAYLLKKQIEYNAALGGKSLVSIPYKTSYATLADIIKDIEGFDITQMPGAGTAPAKVGLVARFNPTTQLYENLYWTGSEWFSDRTDGNMPPMVTGEGIEIRAIAAFSHTFAGEYDPNFTMSLAYSAARGNKNLISIPYNTDYTTLASMLRQIEGFDVTQMPGAGTAPTKVALVARFNPTTQQYENLYFTGSEWFSDRADGNMPPIVIGEGYEINILQSFNYKPSVQ